MLNLTKTGVATAICATVAATALPVESRAGVMSVTDKAHLSLASLTDQVHWRRYGHRHWGRWHYGWHRGWHRHYGYYRGWRRYGYYPSYYGPYYGPYYGAWGYNPVGATVGAAAGLAALPFVAATSPWWW
jgi:hypothetical protein